MTTRRKPAGPTRTGFTLIELLVVIFLLAILAGLAFLFIPNLNDQQRAPRGAVMLQQWLLIAKNNALRDRAGRGLRLSVTNVPDPANSNNSLTVATDAQYIEQPDPFAVTPGVVTDPAGNTLPVRRIFTDPTDATLKTIKLEGASGSDFWGGFGATQQSLWPVQVGDYLEVNGGLPHLIVAPPANTPATATTLYLASPLPAAISSNNPTANYRILRAPRVVGDEQLQMPFDIVIDLGTNTTYGNPLPIDPMTSTIDILFSPSGAVISRGTATDVIYLWVRDSQLLLGQGDNTLVAIQVRTGAAFAYPVDNTPSGDPYSIAKTGRAPQS